MSVPSTIFYLVFAESVSWLGPMDAAECSRLREMVPSATCRLPTAVAVCPSGPPYRFCPVFDDAVRENRKPE